MKPTYAGVAAFSVSLLAILAARQVPEETHPVHPNLHGTVATLSVGGGPTRHENQAGIESNVRYVDLLLPSSSSRRVLFADGDLRSKSVFCEGSSGDYYREPKLTRIDGPSTNASVNTELAGMANALASRPGTPALLFFTGHGGGDTQGDYADNYYCTWKDDQLAVTQLAKDLVSFPKKTPIVLVMVECFSGGFGNLLFQDGNPDSAMVDRPICGFFAATAYRMSAGCTPEINEANYRDFTGYFFAALTGVDRLGNPVSGADYNHNGRITMDEAFAYTLIHDPSIDTPVCTSDVFLRKYVTSIEEADCFKTRYSDVLSWATPAQSAALQALRADLDLNPSGDMQAAYHEFRRADPNGEGEHVVRLIRFCRLFKSVVLAHVLMSSDDANLKQRFKALIQLESTNPLVDRREALLSKPTSRPLAR